MEGSPKGKRLISVKSKSGDYDLICPDAVTYGKWMDAITLVFRELHVDPEKFSKMVNSADEEVEDSPNHNLKASSSAHDPHSSAEISSSVADGAESDSISTSDGSGDRRSASKPNIPDRPAVPSRPSVANVNPGSDGVSRADSKPDVPTRAGRPEIPQRPDRGPSTTLPRSPPPGPPPKGTASPSSSSISLSQANSSGSDTAQPAASSSPSLVPPAIPPPTSLKKGSRPPIPTNAPDIKGLQAAATGTSVSSPQNSSAVSPPHSSRQPLSLRTQSLGPNMYQSQVSPRGPVSPRGGMVLPLPPTPSAAAASTPHSSSGDSSKKFIVWMPNGMKNGSTLNADMSIRSYLEKICKPRESVTPDTFIAKNADGTAVDIDTPIGKLPGGPIHEIWWDTLAPGFSMPADFGITPSVSSSAISQVVVPPAKDATASGGSGRATPSASRTSQGTSDAPSDTSPSNVAPVDHRTKIVREILSTEQSYVESLMKLKEGFITPLLAIVDPQNSSNPSFTSVSGGSSQPELSSSKSSAKLAYHASIGYPAPEVIRSFTPKNFEAILGFNDMFCKELAACKADAIGALFLKYLAFLKIYNDYSSDYHASLGVYNKALRDYPVFTSKLDELRAQTGSKLRIEDYIIMPVQRVPRYSLLISDLLKHTPTSHEDYSNLQTVERQLSEIGSFINESVRKSDGAKRLREFEDKGVAVDRLITPYRFLVREGPVKVIEQKKKETKHFFLFNDILVQVKDSSMTKGVDLSLPEYVWPLTLIWIREDDQLFEIIGPNGASMTIKKKKADLTWMRDLSQRILAYVQKNDPSVTVLGSKRVGMYTSPQDEQYDGEWLDGLKHGTGRCVVAGSVYEGSWESGKRSGKGSLTFANGQKYVGDWKSDLQQGQGVLSLSDAEVIYSGMWSKGTPTGSGTMTYWPSGDVYKGDFYEGRCTGQGTLVCANGTRYEGQWLDDQFDGRGTLSSVDAGTYEGQFRAGLKSGKGTMHYKDGSKYTGEWLDGFRHGKGEFVDVDGTAYEGDWLDDRPEGKGIKTWADGMRYEGQFYRGVRKGQGKMTYYVSSTSLSGEASSSSSSSRPASNTSSAKYEGAWLDDLPNGTGTYTAADGSVYAGEWVAGRREGKGVHTYASGAKYDGTWYNDRFHKTGTYTAAPSFDNIKSYDGDWLFGKMSSSKALLTFQNGDSFRGAFKDGRAHGAGTYTYSFGATFTGKWNVGLRDGKGSYFPSGDDSKARSYAGQFDLSSNILATSSLPIYLPPQQPLFLIAPAIEAIRLHRR